MRAILLGSKRAIVRWSNANAIAARGYSFSPKQDTRSGALSLATDITLNLKKGGIKTSDLCLMLRPFKQRTGKPPDVSGPLNARILQIITDAVKRFNLGTLQRSTRDIGAVISALMAFGIPEPMARDILHNNALLLAMEKEEVSSLCWELQQSGVNVGDYASIISQHSITCCKNGEHDV